MASFLTGSAGIQGMSQPLTSGMFKAAPVTLEFHSETMSVDEPKNKQMIVEQNLEFGSLYSYIRGRYTRAKDARLFDEQRWLEAYRNFRGIYGPEVQFTATEKSRAFAKITAMKVNAAYAKIIGVLLADGRFPIGIEAYNNPIALEANVSFDPQSPENSMGGQPGAAPAGVSQVSGPQVSATIARPGILKALGPVEETVSKIKDKLVPGVISTPTAAIWSPAQEAARLMDKQITDQLNEAEATTALRSLIFELVLLGSGVFKGPILVTKEYPRWDETGQYVPDKADIPDVDYISLWDAYPDPEARKASEMEYFIQRHRLSKTQLRALKKRPYFRSGSIDLAINAGANYEEEYWEQTLKDNKLDSSTERYEVLEYWGLVDSDVAELADIDIPPQFKDMDEVQVNVWICNNQILRIVYNPYTPTRIPYYITPYEANPYSIFGIGVGENMSDMQLLMNGFVRLLVDNAVISSNIVFEINENNLSPNQDFEMYPGKVFRTQGQPGQSMFATKFPNVTQECILAFDKFRQLADEATGLPSYSHGMSGVMSTGRTAAGMSMLMGAADESIKSVIKNIDDYLFVPLGQSLYAFNMQFNFDKKYIGDIKVVALGTDSLMRNEISTQKLTQFLQMSANPLDAPYTNRPWLWRELARRMELDPDKAVVDQRQAIVNAQIMKDMALAMGIPPQNMMQAGAGNGPSAPSGGQNNGAAVPQPGQPGSTGAGGGQNSPPPPTPSNGPERPA